MQIDAIGKVLIAVGALSYAVGVFIVSSDLADYGVTDFSVSRPQYVLAGVGWLIVTCIIFAPPAILAIPFQHMNLKSGRSIRALLLAVAFSWWISTKCVRALCNHGEDTLDLIGLIVPIQVVAFVWSRIHLGAYYKERKRIENAENGDTNERAPQESIRPWFFMAALVSVLAFVPIWVPFYLEFIYPSMGPQFGGGKHPTGLVVFQDPKAFESAPLLKELVPASIDDKKTTGQVLLLDISTDFIAIAPGEHTNTSILIRKDQVASIVVCAPKDVGSSPDATQAACRPREKLPGAGKRPIWRDLLDLSF
ncbi:MAG: hypothetical protein ABSD61_13040 [Terracidiphilus sp.]